MLIYPRVDLQTQTQKNYEKSPAERIENVLIWKLKKIPKISVGIEDHDFGAKIVPLVKSEFETNIFLGILAQKHVRVLCHSSCYNKHFCKEAREFLVQTKIVICFASFAVHSQCVKITKSLILQHCERSELRLLTKFWFQFQSKN